MRNRDSEGYMVGSRGGRTRGVCLADYWKGIKKVQGVVAPVNVPSRKLKKKFRGVTRLVASGFSHNRLALSVACMFVHLSVSRMRTSMNCK